MTLVTANEAETTPAWLQPDTYVQVVELAPPVSLDMVLPDPDRRILLGYRNNRPAQGTWFVPGGRVGKNETRAEAWLRITHAEIGTRSPGFDRARFLDVYEHLYPDNFAGRPGFGTHYVVLEYKMEVDPDELQLRQSDSQHGGFLWLREAETIVRPDLHPYTKAYCSKTACASLQLEARLQPPWHAPLTK